MASILTRSKLSLFVTAIASLYIVFNLTSWEKKNLLGFDDTGYYLYLPATIIYHDIDNYAFYPKINEEYGLNMGAKWYGLYDEPTGRKMNKYHIGTSIFELPFFLVAHWYCTTYPKDNPPDGYSRPYMMALIFCMIFWVFAGLSVLRKFLLVYFNEGVTAITLLLLAFGTNLYFYTFFEIGMSHPFSFALFCFLLYETQKWYSTERFVHVLLLGLVLGLMAITRPTNMVAILIPLCWRYKNGLFSEKLALYRKQIAAITFSIIIFLLVLMAQCGYWKYAAGHWIYFSYEGEGFDFLHPHIWEGLFSYRKGWFTYTPVAFLGIIGLIPLWAKHKWLAVLVLLYLVVNIYVVFSWKEWVYGGSFGCRALIESLPVVAIPLAMLIQQTMSVKKVSLRISLLTVLGLLIALNLFQCYQLKENITVWDKTNRAFYWRSFGKLHVTEEDKKLLDQ